MNNDGIWLLKCICDYTRFEILGLLQEHQEMRVGDFVRLMKKDQPLVSHHLKTLKKCGIVTSRRQGKNIMYQISNPDLAKLISDLANTEKNILSMCNIDKNSTSCIC